MELKLYQIDPKSVPTEEKIHLSLNHPLVYEGLTLDFKNGTITCTRTKEYKIVEYVAFSFSVSLLYNLCVPRSKLTPEKIARRHKDVLKIPGANMSFMTAAGLLLFDTPSNYYMYHTFGVLFCRLLPDSCGNESDQRQCIISSDGDIGDCCGGDIKGVNDKETLLHVHGMKSKDIAEATVFSHESVSLLKADGLLYSTLEACGIELDQSRSAINSNNGELGGDKGSHEHNGDGNDKGGSDCKNVGSAGGKNGVVGVVCGNDRFRDGCRGGRNGEVDYYCGGRSGFGGGCGGGGCRGGGACGGGCGGGGCGGGGGGCGGCGCDWAWDAE